ncbi:hypothetical protein BOO86_11775 [Mycobacterium sp. CBMA 234]|nr:hypothetical protein [Mycolicibacterium sp. CBMA 234]
MLTVLVPLAVVCAYAAQLVQPVVHTAVTPTSEIVSAPSTIGIADSSLYGMSQQDIDTTLDMLQSMGVQDVRVFIPWIYTEPLKGVYNWAPIDAIMNAAKARNMGVLAMVNSTPLWAGTAGTIPGAQTPDPTAYANFMGKVAARYAKTVSAYEVWNEVNCVCFYDPVSPQSYTDLLKAAYPAIKAADPSATVIAAGLGAVFSLGGITMNPVDYVNAMYAAGAKGFFDALAFHPYQESMPFSDGQGVPLSPYTQIQKIYDLMVANGDAAKKIWLTEYGVPTNNVSEQTQADFIKNLIDTWQSMSFGGPIFIYTTRDGQPGSGYFGIFDANWVPKEAAFVIAQEILRLNGVGGVEGIAARILAALRLAVGAVVDVIANVGKAVVKVADAAWTAFVNVTKAVTQAVVNTVKWVTNAVVQGVKWVANTAVDVTKAVVAGITNVIQKIGDIIRPPAAAVPPTTLNAMAAMKEAAAALDPAKTPDTVKPNVTAALKTTATDKGVQGSGSEIKGSEIKGTETKTVEVKAPEAKDPEKTVPEVKTPDAKGPASAEPDPTTPPAKDGPTSGADGKTSASPKDSSDPKKDQPKPDVPKRDKGKKPGQGAKGDSASSNNDSSDDISKGAAKGDEAPKLKPKSKPAKSAAAAAAGTAEQGAKSDQG